MSNVINKPIVIKGKKVDRWFIVGGHTNEFWQKKEYAEEAMKEGE